jgi:hypothetical protein
LTDTGGTEQLLVFGFGGQACVDAVQKLAADTGLPVGWIVGNGGGHHMFLDLWFTAFPDARILVPAQRVPHTRNGLALAEKHKDRWELMHGPKPAQLVKEFGDQIDVVIFDQLMAYSDQYAAKAVDAAQDHTSNKVRVGGFALMKFFGKMTKQFDQTNDEVFLLHRASGLVVAGHNFPFIYRPKGYKAPPRFKMKLGGFPMGFFMNMGMPPGSFKSALEMQAQPIADSQKHWDEWQMVLDWDFSHWVTCHDPPQVSGPPGGGEAIKAMIRASLAKSGEDDPTGARLKWNKKHKQ